MEIGKTKGRVYVKWDCVPENGSVSSGVKTLTLHEEVSGLNLTNFTFFFLRFPTFLRSKSWDCSPGVRVKYHGAE